MIKAHEVSVTEDGWVYVDEPAVLRVVRASGLKSKKRRKIKKRFRKILMAILEAKL